MYIFTIIGFVVVAITLISIALYFVSKICEKYTSGYNAINRIYVKDGREKAQEAIDEYLSHKIKSVYCLCVYIGIQHAIYKNRKK